MGAGPRATLLVTPAPGGGTAAGPTLGAEPPLTDGCNWILFGTLGTKGTPVATGGTLRTLGATSTGSSMAGREAAWPWRMAMGLAASARVEPVCALL
ncbi:hypothetical protein THAOC_34215 [Thalassiosira oceanica]|uniref:Uncharacterized protein n=1 Tax=Thalassiosira oceanica TaxID=159749 RepID=K0R3U7_THAOC|nr:hypothetical protein THAOC_34215 [Thalassiosira oceanica]|eukprot:EJK47090.1 hypothetical protein THAOC_34215 [Thalassiosira oceanica]